MAEIKPFKARATKESGGEKGQKTTGQKGLRAFISHVRGPRRTGWWPGKTRFEVIAGAILTQNTAWTNVERPSPTSSQGVLSPAGCTLEDRRAAALIRPRLFQHKAKRLKNFTDYLLRSITEASTGF